MTAPIAWCPGLVGSAGASEPDVECPEGDVRVSVQDRQRRGSQLVCMPRGSLYLSRCLVETFGVNHE